MSLRHVQLFATPWTVHSPQNSPGQNTGIGSHSILQGNLPNPGTEPRSPTLQANSLPAEPPGKFQQLAVTGSKSIKWNNNRMWSTGEGNGNPMNNTKRQKDRTLKDELPRLVGAPQISGEITPERMKGWSQSKNTTQLWMALVIEARFDAIKSNTA